MLFPHTSGYFSDPERTGRFARASERVEGEYFCLVSASQTDLVPRCDLLKCASERLSPSLRLLSCSRSKDNQVFVHYDGYLEHLLKIEALIAVFFSKMENGLTSNQEGKVNKPTTFSLISPRKKCHALLFSIIGRPSFPPPARLL
jgi:hypothetical protein